MPIHFLAEDGDEQEPGMTWRESITASVMTVVAMGRRSVSASRASARVSIFYWPGFANGCEPYQVECSS